MKKLYFAGSIRGGRDDAELYQRIIKYLSKKFIVLTEHIGDKSITASGEVKMTDFEIYERDIDWIKECDIVVAEVSNPSLGVGYEIAYAENLKKPVHCLYRLQDGKRLSAMIGGDKNLNIYNYKTFEDVKEIIDSF